MMGIRYWFESNEGVKACEAIEQITLGIDRVDPCLSDY
jgi:hypothetical protein